METAVEMAMASALGLHGVPLVAAAFCGSPWKVRGRPWSVRGCPCNAVDMAVECGGDPWTLPRCSANETNIVHLFHAGVIAGLSRPYHNNNRMRMLPIQ